MPPNDFNACEPPRSQDLTEDGASRQTLLSQRTKYLWLAMLPSLIPLMLPLIMLFPFFWSMIAFLLPLIIIAFLWVGSCASHIESLNSRIFSRSSRPGRVTAIIFGLLLMNFIVGVVLLFVGCCLYGTLPRIL